MTLKIIKRFETVHTTEQRFAGGGAELRNHFGIGGPAQRAGDGLALAEQRFFIEACRGGWGNAEVQQFLPSGFGEPFGGPGRAEHGGDFHALEAAFLQGRADVYLDGVHGRATAVSGRDYYFQCVAGFVPVQVAQDAEFSNGEGRDFRIANGFE